MKNRGGRASIRLQQWLTYGGLSLLAAAAVTVSAIALAPRPETVTAGYTPRPIASSASTAAPTPTQAPVTTPPPPKIKLPTDPSVLIMGDSYTEGAGTQSPEREGWAYVAAGLLGLSPRMDSIAGTGFAWGGGASSELGRQFSTRLQDIADQKIIAPDVIILQGGQNDALLRNDAQVTDAVVATVGQAKKLWPDVQMVIMGPTAPEPLASSLKQTNAAVHAGATAAGVPFIDASGEQWFTPQNSGSYDADGSHVNAAGHKVIAERFATHWRTLTT